MVIRVSLVMMMFFLIKDVHCQGKSIKTFFFFLLKNMEQDI